MLWSVLLVICLFRFNDTSPTVIYTDCHTLSLPDALPVSGGGGRGPAISALATEESAAWAASSGLAASLFRIACLRRDQRAKRLSSPVLIRHHPRCENPALLLQEPPDRCDRACAWYRSEEHTSELQSLMRISYAVFCLKKKKKYKHTALNTNLNIYKIII